MKNLDSIMRTNIDALKKRYAGLGIKAWIDRYNSKITHYEFHSPDRDVFLQLTTPTGKDVSLQSEWHKPINTFYDRHQRFLKGEYGASNKTGDLNSLIY